MSLWSVAIPVRVSVAETILAVDAVLFDTSLVEQHHLDGAGFYRRQGMLDCRVQSLASTDDEDDLTHVHGQRARLRRKKQRRRVEDDDAVTVTLRHFVQQTPQRVAGEQLGRARMRRAAAKEGELLDIGSE